MAVFLVSWRGFYHTAPQIGSPLRVAESVRGMDRPETDGVVDEIHRYAPLARTTAPRRRGDGRSPLRPANGERPASIQHSALSIQHCPRVARAVSPGQWQSPGIHSAFSTQHSAFSTQHSAFGIASAPTRSSCVRSGRSRTARRCRPVPARQCSRRYPYTVEVLQWA